MKKEDKVRKVYNEIASEFNTSRQSFENEKELASFVSLLQPGAKILDVGCGVGVPVAQYLVNLIYRKDILNSVTCIIWRMYGMFDVKAEKAKIVQLLRENVEAANRGDIEASLRHFDKNCYFLSPQMKLMKGLSDLRGFYEALVESFAHTEEYEMIDIQFSENGNMAYMITTYHMVLKGTEGNVDNIGKSLQVLSKKSGKWKIVAVGYNADE